MHPNRQLNYRDRAQLPSTIQACWEGVKGAVRVTGWAVELQAAPRRALNSLSSAVTDSLVWQETGVVVVDKVAEDAAIRERHSEVLHLHRETTHFSPFSQSKTFETTLVVVGLELAWLQAISNQNLAENTAKGYNRIIL